MEVTPIFERSGIKNWTEFCVRFAHSFTQVRASVGSTSQPTRLQEFLDAVENIRPLLDDVVKGISALQRWSDEVDVQAEPRTM